jgi:hypothetical protein
VLAIQLIADLVAPIDRCAPQLGKTEIAKAKGSQKEKMPKICSLFVNHGQIWCVYAG